MADKRDVTIQVSDVERAYWNLYYAYRRLDSAIAGRNAQLRVAQKDGQLRQPFELNPLLAMRRVAEDVVPRRPARLPNEPSRGRMVPEIRRPDWLQARRQHARKEQHANKQKANKLGEHYRTGR